MKTHTLKSGQISVTVQTADGPRSIPTGCSDKTVLKQLITSTNLKDVELAAQAGVLTENLIRKLTVGGNVTIEQAFGQWKEWITHASNSERTAQNSITMVNAWVQHARAKNLRVNQVAEPQVSNWINARDGTSLGTRRVRLASIRSFFRFCVIKDFVARDPSALVRVKAHLLSHEQKEKKVRQCFDEPELQALLNLIQERIAGLQGIAQKTGAEEKRLDTLRFWYAATLLGRWSGLRLGDVCSLEWACFNKKGFMVVWTDKKDTRVALPIGDELCQGIVAIPTNTKKHCFPEQRAMICDVHQRSTLSVQFQRLLADAGIQGKSYHCLRHTLATELNAEGESIEAIAKALGHGSTRATKGYLH